MVSTFWSKNFFSSSHSPREERRRQRGIGFWGTFQCNTKVEELLREGSTWVGWEESECLDVDSKVDISWMRGEQITSKTESEGGNLNWSNGTTATWTMQWRLRVRSLKEVGGLLENKWVIQGMGEWNPHRLQPTVATGLGSKYSNSEWKVNFSRYGRVDSVSGILNLGSEILAGSWKS